jgi:hypothetical protein
MLAIGNVINEAEMWVRWPSDREWLSDPEAFRFVVELINLLLQAIDPDARPTVWAELRRAFYEEEDESPQLIVSHVLAAIADQPHDHLAIGPLISIIRRWIGEAAIARLRDGLALEPQAAGSQVTE